MLADKSKKNAGQRNTRVFCSHDARAAYKQALEKSKPKALKISTRILD